MKKLLIGLCLLIGVTAQAQFKDIDSLRRFTFDGPAKYTPPSPIGKLLIQFLDSAYSSKNKCDSIILFQDSIVNLFLNGVIIKRYTITIGVK